VNGKDRLAEITNCQMTLSVTDTVYHEVASWYLTSLNPRISGSLTFVEGKTRGNGSSNGKED
jgi:hypothetical protein